MKRIIFLLALVACGKDRGAFDGNQPATSENGNQPANDGGSSGGTTPKSDAGKGYGDDIPLPACGPHNCTTGCCTADGKCIGGTEPKA